MGKRAFDLCLATASLVALSPVCAGVALAIKATSPGPVFYRGVRTGRGGKEFRIFKFRSMVVDAERLGGPSTASNDVRVTAVGRFIRRCKLDELPQLLNIVAGDMSFVGPRPDVPAYTALYAGEERLITTVRPGLTDFASVQFIQLDDMLGQHDADRVYLERVLPVKNQLRVKYVKERSFAVDLRLIGVTMLRVLSVRRANPIHEPSK